MNAVLPTLTTPQAAAATAARAKGARPGPRVVSVADPFKSFWMGGFEGADHVNSHAQPLDMVLTSGHVDHIDMDYARLKAWGLRTVRESIGWRLSERDGAFDFSRAKRFAQSAREHGIQILWSLMHYGMPADVDLLHDSFCERFARYARAAAQALADLHDDPPVYSPINEVSFMAWAASQTRMIHPYGKDAGTDAGTTLVDGFHIKCRLIKAVLMGMAAIREVDPRARFMHIDPVVHVVPPANRPDLQGLADEVRSYQWQTWDMLCGRMLPELGGSPGALDIIGVNHYHSGQWEVLTEKRLRWDERDPRRMPFSALLNEVWDRYRRPIVVAETSHYGDGRGDWLDGIAAEVAQACRQGVPVQGLCLYPIVDRHDWDDFDHWHHSGLWDRPDGADLEPQWPRQLNLTYAKALRRWQERLPCLPE